MKSIVLWGERHSGKSGLLGALRSEAARTAGERWALDVTGADPETTDYVESASLALRLRDVKATPVKRPEGAVTLTVKRFVGSREQNDVQLLVVDPRGTLDERALEPATREALHALASADGIVWLLETRVPGAEVSGRDRLLRQVVGALEAVSAPQVTVPVAIVLTKLDRMPASEMRRAFERPEESLREQLGDAAFGWLVAACPRLRCFALSAAGTVRNAARPLGLSAIFDWFSAEWRRGERQAELVQARERRSARVARVRRKTPIAALAIAAAAVVVFAGGATARRLLQRTTTWSSAAGGIATSPRDTGVAEATPARALDVPASAAAVVTQGDPTAGGSLDSVFDAYARGDTRSVLRALVALRMPSADTSWFAADSVVALVALRGVDEALRAAPPDTGLLRLVVAATSAAIVRAHPGTYVLAPLSVARAEACIAGRLDCPVDRLREDLAWALLLGTPQEQDTARRLRTAWLADTLSPGT